MIELVDADFVVVAILAATWALFLLVGWVAS